MHEHRRRARKVEAGGSYALTDIDLKLVAQQWRCVYCKSDIRSRYHVDHITPLCRGGSNGPENIQLLCPPCNLAKGRSDHEGFLKRLEKKQEAQNRL